jgi:alkylated DNA repair protein (DNA oxidative demethylase)
MNLDLFSSLEKELYSELIAPEAVILHGYGLTAAPELLDDLKNIIKAAPFRHLTTPGGYIMSVAMSNCGSYGWISDIRGYRYDAIDPLTQKQWPPIPMSFLRIALAAAEKAGFPNFRPDACLINKYCPSAKLSLHQDKDETNFNAPVVSISLGVPAVFLFGGLQRKNKTQRFLLEHGDVVVWGGVSRLSYHGIMPLKDGYHPLVGNYRLNLTFRQSH